MRIENVSVFDSTSTDVHPLAPNQTVVVRDGLIRFVGPAGKAPAPDPGARTIDATGMTLLPGFVDIHTHIQNSGAPAWALFDADPQANLEAWLSAGVTTVVDLGGQAGPLRELITDMNQGKFDGPRIYYAHLPGTGPGGHPLPLIEIEEDWLTFKIIEWIYPQLETEDDAIAFVQASEDEGAHVIKLMFDQLPRGTPQLKASLIEATAKQAHRRGMRLFVHVGTEEDALQACRAGADVLAHMPYRGVITAEGAQELAERGCLVVATISVWRTTDSLGRRTWEPSVLDQRWGRPEQLAALAQPAPPKEQVHPVFLDLINTAEENRELWGPNARTLFDHGVTLLIGTDAPLPGNFAGSAFHHELWQLAELGIPPADLLRAATLTSARVLEPEPNFGSIEVNKVADLVLVQGDPTLDVRAASAIQLVVRRGKVVRDKRR